MFRILQCKTYTRTHELSRPLPGAPTSFLLRSSPYQRLRKKRNQNNPENDSDAHLHNRIAFNLKVETFQIETFETFQIETFETLTSSSRLTFLVLRRADG